MSTIIPFLIFCTVLAFVFYAWSFFTRGQDTINEHVARRLRGEYREKNFKMQLEKKLRLSDLPLLDRILKAALFIKHFQTWIHQSGLAISAGVLILIACTTGAGAFVVCLGIQLDPLITLVLTALAFFLPCFFVAFKRSKRIKLFSEHFPDAIARIASSLRAGYSMQMAIEALLEDSHVVITEEFQKILAELEIGQSFETALQRMLERMDTPDLRLFIASVSIQRESGGNLAELMDNLENTIRQRFELQRELHSAAAQAKFSGLVLSLLPVFVGVVLFFIHRTYVLFLFTDPVGKKLFYFSVIGQILGVFTIRKIVKIET